MKQKGRVAAAVLQVLAILVLIVAIPSTCFYFAMDDSLNEALASDTVPELFGYQFIPVQTDSVSKIIDKGSLVMISEKDARDVDKWDVILYEAASANEDNVVYEHFAISTVQEVVYGANRTYTVKSYNQPNEEGIAVPETLLKGEIGWTVAYLGDLTKWVLSPYGLLFFVVIPCGVFLLLQLISILVRVLGKQEEQVDQEEKSIEELLEELTIEQPKVSAEPQIKSQTVSSMESQMSPDAQFDSPVGEIGLVTPDTVVVQEDPAEKQRIESQEKLEAFRRGGLPILEKNPVTPDLNWKEHTIEFDMEAIREKMLQEELLKDFDEQDFVKMPEKQEIVDKILIEMKDSSLDFSFKNIHSEDITIEKTALGDGFVIQTPNYQATICIDVRPK